MVVAVCVVLCVDFENNNDIDKDDQNKSYRHITPTQQSLQDEEKLERAQKPELHEFGISAFLTDFSGYEKHCERDEGRCSRPTYYRALIDVHTTLFGFSGYLYISPWLIDS